MNGPKLSRYFIGFILSVFYTVTAYFITVKSKASFWTLITVLVVLAVAQLAVQLLYFLHLGEELRPRWQLLAFGFMSLVVVILVVGSLWIMSNLNYNHARRSPTDTNNYLIKDEGVQPEANP